MGIGVAPSAPLTIGRVSSTNEGGQIDLCRSTDNASTWGIDVYGDTSTPSLRILDNIAAAVRLQIDGSGRVTMPHQPRFFARSNYSSGTGPSGVYVFATVDINIGNGYNSSNGRFTAPVSGTYYIFASALSRSATGLNSYLRLNGSNALVYSEDSRSGSYGDVHPKILYNLSAGDYIEFYCNNSTYGNAYDYFGGWLVA